MKIVLPVNEIVYLYTIEKWTILDIAKKFNVNFGTIKLRLKKANVIFRSHKENQKMVMNRPEVKIKTSEASKRSNDKRIKTNIERYGSAVPASGKEIKKIWKEKHLKEYGKEWPNQRKEIRDKFKNTCKKKYDVDNVSKIKEVKDKIIKNRWENKSEKELNDIKEKTEKNNIEKYGYKFAIQNDEIKEKSKKRRWDDKTEEELNEIKKKSLISMNKRALIILKERFKNLNLEIVDPDNCLISKLCNVKCLKCGTIFETVPSYIQYGYGVCPTCYPPYTSRYFQKPIQDYIKSIYDKKVLINNRRILKNKKELDIVLPDIKLAIECDGLRWHNENNLDNPVYYHLEKTNKCKDIGYRLIHIFEDEWYGKADIVKARLKQIIGSNDSERIHARKCIIKEIDNKSKNIFLNKYHIQGKDNSKIKLGAFYNNELMSIMTFGSGNIAKGSKTKEGVWELNRFCSDSDYRIVGIAGKLLSYFKKNYEWKEVFSYADKRWSDGGLYLKLGFILEHESKPNYWYVKNSHRIHRFNLRKHPNENKDIPEWVLRLNEGYSKIWDCGNLKFVIKNY